MNLGEEVKRILLENQNLRKENIELRREIESIQSDLAKSNQTEKESLRQCRCSD